MADAGLLEVVDVLELLDFEQVCESRDGCERAAVWAFVYLCCGGVQLFCDEHRVSFVEWLEEQERDRQVIQHRRCGAKGFAYRWERLRGGA
ncbi:hypothetical protein [Agrococcus pavilionensis]|uniref:hypothetical protein n=1 Tax=Agrococcus pavilionensis TaxID=1346502 RepID=UPI0011817923|nr:hypothetical protein [Agrococcus pavilionensis]